MKKLLVYTLALGLITGIIPTLVVGLMENSILLTIIIGIVAILWTAYELCK